jgi:hypothetical protein
MKKHLILALALTLLSTAAFASKARLLALGENKDDASYFINDNRRVLTNAAFINMYSDLMLFEYGDSAGAAAVGADTDAAPKAEGGFYKKAGNLNYGLFVGSENDTVVLFHTVAGMTNSNPNAKIDNVIQFIVGGDAGIKWGAAALYSKNEKKTDGTDKFESDYMAVRLGVDNGNWDAFANLGLKNDADEPLKAAPTKFEGKLSVHAGAGLDAGPGRAFISAKKGSWDQTLSGAKTEGTFNYLTAGYGIQQDMGDKGTLFTKLAYEKTSVELKFAASKSEFDHMIVPLTVGYEKAATEWLTLRGAVSHNLLSKAESKNLTNINATGRATAVAKYSLVDNAEQTIPNSTNVTAGATLNFGKLSVDGLVGALNASDAAGETGTLKLDNLFTRAAVNYSF